MSDLSTKVMTKTEAETCVSDIRSGIANIGRRLFDLYEGKGWLALGYQSWRDCAEGEFGYKKTRVYQLLDAEIVNQNISTIVEKPVSEGVAREIAKAGSPEKQREVAAEAVKTAPKDKAGKPKVTAKHVQAVVAKRVEPLAITPEPAKPAAPAKPAPPSDPWAHYNALVAAAAQTIELARKQFDELATLPEPDSAFSAWLGDGKAYRKMFSDTLAHLENHRVIGFATMAQTKAAPDGRNFLYHYETHKKRRAS